MIKIELTRWFGETSIKFETKRTNNYFRFDKIEIQTCKFSDQGILYEKITSVLK